MKFNAAIFDMDGLMFDTESYFCARLRAISEKQSATGLRVRA